MSISSQKYEFCEGKPCSRPVTAVPQRHRVNQDDLTNTRG